MIFLNIVYKFIDTNKYFFPELKDFDILNNFHKTNCNISEDNNFTSYYLYFYLSKLIFLFNNDNKIKKFEILDELLSNIFISDESKEKLLDTFSLIQRTYYAFSKIAYIYKFKKSTIKAFEDLSLNPIVENKKNVFTLFQNNSKYLFLNSFHRSGKL
jgi:hypothetical protein